MSITVVCEDGVVAPVITCDKCNKRILDPSDGEVYWNSDPFTDSRPINVTIVDKKCSYLIENEFGWEELRHFLGYLLMNCGMTNERARNIRKELIRLHEIGL